MSVGIQKNAASTFQLAGAITEPEVSLLDALARVGGSQPQGKVSATVKQAAHASVPQAGSLDSLQPATPSSTVSSPGFFSTKPEPTLSEQLQHATSVLQGTLGKELSSEALNATVAEVKQTLIALKASPDALNSKDTSASVMALFEALTARQLDGTAAGKDPLVRAMMAKKRAQEFQQNKSPGAIIEVVFGPVVRAIARNEGATSTHTPGTRFGR